MRRLIQVLAVLFTILVFSAIACVAAVFIISGEVPTAAARDWAAQISLVMQRDALYAPAGSSSQNQRFEVEPGSSTTQIATKLQRAGLITSTDLFVNYAVANDIDVQLEAGTYFLSNSLTIPEIAILLTDSKSSQIPFRILEGWRKEEIAVAIDQNGLFAFTGADFLPVVQTNAEVPADFAAYVGLPENASLEGFLYPDTYLLPPNITPVELRDTLLRTFRERVPVQLVNDALAQDLSIYEVVTLASIAEREAVHNDEFPLIMSVYRNRLAEGMLLGADPTVQYALDNSRGTWWAQITRADYQGVISPYNTYLNEGLPPGPIANPGIASIEAAVFPQESDYLFFRAACNSSGYHEFAITYEEHLRNGCTG